jgi:hypothetical protein
MIASCRPGKLPRLPWLLLCLLCSRLPAQTTPDAAEKRLGVFFWHDSPNDVATFAGIRSGLERVACAASSSSAAPTPMPAKAKACVARTACSRLPGLVFALGTQAALVAKTELPTCRWCSPR